MELAALTRDVVLFVTPFLPYLLSKAGDAAAEAAVEKFGEAAWEKAKELWGKVRGKRNIEEAAEDVVEMPGDSDAQASLRLQLKKQLKQNEGLAKELARLMEEAKEAGVTVTASGERSVAVGGSLSGSTVITGDRNVVGDRTMDEDKK